MSPFTVPFRYLTALPVYNESKHIPLVLREVQKYAQDVLVVDDGSSDETPQLLQQTAGIITIRHPQNLGYGGALVTAFNYAIKHNYDAVVTIDCDGQHQPQLIPHLVSALNSSRGEEFDLVSGSRYMASSTKGEIPPPIDRRRINFEITAMVNRELCLNLTDTFCGFKSYRTSALEKLSITEFGYAMPLQFWVQAVACGLSILEFPVPLIYLDEKRSFGGNLDQAEIRKAHYKEVFFAEVAKQKRLLQPVVENCCCGIF